MQLAEKHAVRFLHVMSCTNAHAPLGMGLWEGVPLREVIWLTRPTANVRRVFYYGYPQAGCRPTRSGSTRPRAIHEHGRCATLSSIGPLC